VIPAITGLAGAAAGVALAHFRWARDRATAREAPYEERRRDAYDGLWRVVETAHGVARTAPPKSAAAERDLLAEVNSFAMVNGVYIDAVDRQLAHEYISEILRFLANLEAADRPKYREMMASTAAFPRDFGPTVRALAEEGNRVEGLRLELRSRVQAVIRGRDSGCGELRPGTD
jgi:hypothetical protein